MAYTARPIRVVIVVMPPTIEWNAGYLLKLSVTGCPKMSILFTAQINLCLKPSFLLLILLNNF